MRVKKYCWRSTDCPAKCNSVFSCNDNLLAVLVSQMIVLDLFDRFESVVVEENLDQSIGRETDF